MVWTIVLAAAAAVAEAECVANVLFAISSEASLIAFDPAVESCEAGVFAVMIAVPYPQERIQIGPQALQSARL